MASLQEYENAAKKSPSARTVQEQKLVDDAYKAGLTTVKNLDHEARKS